jgi:hydroxypyruvate reductase
MTSPAPKLFLAAIVPPDIRTALSARYPVTERGATWPGVPAPGFTVAATTSMAGFDKAMFDGLPDLKIVICNGAGLDRIDLKEAAKRGIAVCNTPDELAEDVADAAIALTYAIMRRVVESDRFVRSGRWMKERMAPSRRVGGKTMGVVGLGKIGRRIAQRATGIGMNVMYLSRRAYPDVPHTPVNDILTLAERVDVLVLSCPGGAETHHLVNHAVLEKLGKTGYLINISRGSVVDEEALIAALQAGTIAGAALDVFAREPEIDPRFAAMENVILQPHSTSITHETRQAMVDRLLGDLDAFLTGRSFHNAAA